MSLLRHKSKKMAAEGQVYEKVPSLLFECCVTTPHENHLALGRLVLKACGFHDDAICEAFENKCWSLKIFSEDKNQTAAVKAVFRRLRLPDFTITVKSLRSSQWLTRWKNNWKPLSLTKTIDVVPAWHKNRHKTSKKIIVLDTLMSFGTGMHETTQLMAQLIEDNASRLGSVLDIGTGTGILALTALKSGACDVTAMDISPLSIEAANSNLKANGLKAKLVLSDVGHLRLKRKYQTVAANLVTDDLLKLGRKIAGLVKGGGLLLVSGISLDNVARLKKGFQTLPLICRTTMRGKQWAALCYEKKM